MALAAAPQTEINRTIAYRYDSLNRLTDADYCDGRLTRSTCLDQIASIVSSYDYVYDRVGNLKTETIFDGVETVITGNNYNAANQLTTSYVGGQLSAYTYDKAGNLTRIIGVPA